jgi:hypothetical protein
MKRPLRKPRSAPAPAVANHGAEAPAGYSSQSKPVGDILKEQAEIRRLKEIKRKQQDERHKR